MILTTDTFSKEHNINVLQLPIFNIFFLRLAGEISVVDILIGFSYYCIGLGKNQVWEIQRFHCTDKQYGIK